MIMSSMHACLQGMERFHATPALEAAHYGILNTCFLLSLVCMSSVSTLSLLCSSGVLCTPCCSASCAGSGQVAVWAQQVCRAAKLGQRLPSAINRGLYWDGWRSAPAVRRCCCTGA